MAAVAAPRALAALVLLAAWAGPAHAQPRPAAAPSPAPVATAPPAMPPAARPLALATVAAIEPVVRAEMARLGVPGLSISVAKDGALAWSGAYGLADVENEVPARPDTMYRFASLSKPITAVAVMQLVERGKLTLDQQVPALVPEFPAKQWPLTVRHLLSHQGGVRSYHDGEFSSTKHYGSVIQALETFAGDPLLFQPGTRFLYSTWGYTLLGAVVEKAAQVPYLDYVRQNVFTPAGMASSRDDNHYAIIPRRARGYVKPPGGELRNSGITDTSVKIPGGGLMGTADDAARFGAALLAGTLVSPATFATMAAEQRTSDRKLTTAGFGVFLSEHKGMREVWHTGGQQRVSTVLYLRPRTRTTVAILCNLEGVREPLLELARHVAAVVDR